MFNVLLTGPSVLLPVELPENTAFFFSPLISALAGLFTFRARVVTINTNHRHADEAVMPQMAGGAPAFQQNS